MTSAVRYANKLTHLFFMSCHECMMHKYKKQRLGVYPYWSSSVFTMIIYKDMTFHCNNLLYIYL